VTINKLFCVDGQTEVIKQTVAFHNSADVPKNRDSVAGIWHTEGASNLDKFC
jgi:hypothetical protein